LAAVRKHRKHLSDDLAMADPASGLLGCSLAASRISDRNVPSRNDDAPTPSASYALLLHVFMDDSELATRAGKLSFQRFYPQLDGQLIGF
jgi:hypothetical protein